MLDNLPIKIEKVGNRIKYTRETADEKVEKFLPDCEIFVSPVEPVNLPRNITRFLEIDFPPIMLEPNAIERIYLKFPIEIGVFAKKGDKIAVVDVFTFNKPKYTLYGNPKSGVVCRWYRSEVYYDIPKVDPLKDGVLELTVRNIGDWTEVSKVVFDCYAMKIYYDDFAGMVAEMRIASKNTAETSFIDKPLRNGMKKAVELYTTRRLIGKSFVMEWGLK